MDNIEFQTLFVNFRTNQVLLEHAVCGLTNLEM